MKLFYVRCSTIEQNESRQTEAAREVGAEKVFLDKLSGKDTHRPQLQEMLAFCREGDVVVVSELSRLARSTRDLLRIVDDLQAKHVELVSLKEQIDTATPQGRFVLTIFAALAELERETILQRQREGIAVAKAEGRYKGRPKAKIDTEHFTAVCKRWRAGELTAIRAQELTGTKPNTFYRRVKEMRL